MTGTFQSDTGGTSIPLLSKDGKLLADCETPKGFKVVGYIAPYYYSQIIGGEEDGSMTVYRFKLD